MKLTFNSLLIFLLLLVAAVVIGRFFYFKPKFINGEKAPEIVATNINGDAFRLSELQGAYVLLDFWGSWCPPCRKENPDLVRLYESYQSADFKKADGFEIVGVAIERTEGSWKNAIEKDNLHWPYHIMDRTSSMKFFDAPIATAYKVREVPTKFLLNPDGVIIAVNPEMKVLKRLLDEQLK